MADCGDITESIGAAMTGMLEVVGVDLPGDRDLLGVPRTPRRHDRDVVEGVRPAAALAPADLDLGHRVEPTDTADQSPPSSRAYRGLSPDPGVTSPGKAGNRGFASGHPADVDAPVATGRPVRDRRPFQRRALRQRGGGSVRVAEHELRTDASPSSSLAGPIRNLDWNWAMFEDAGRYSSSCGSSSHEMQYRHAQSLLGEPLAHDRPPGPERLPHRRRVERAGLRDVQVDPELARRPVGAVGEEPRRRTHPRGGPFVLQPADLEDRPDEVPRQPAGQLVARPARLNQTRLRRSIRPTSLRVAATRFGARPAGRPTPAWPAAPARRPRRAGTRRPWVPRRPGGERGRAAMASDGRDEVCGGPPTHSAGWRRHRGVGGGLQVVPVLGGTAKAPGLLREPDRWVTGWSSWVPRRSSGCRAGGSP